MTEPMFEIENYLPAPETQACGRCPTETQASDDQLRVRGWLVYDGLSLANRTLHVRICPTCQKKGSR